MHDGLCWWWCGALMGALQDYVGVMHVFWLVGDGWKSSMLSTQVIYSVTWWWLDEEWIYGAWCIFCCITMCDRHGNSVIDVWWKRWIRWMIMFITDVVLSLCFGSHLGSCMSVGPTIALCCQGFRRFRRLRTVRSGDGSSSCWIVSLSSSPTASGRASRVSSSLARRAAWSNRLHLS